MHILLKNILKENKNTEHIQFYCDMDGVLVDMDGGFKKISDGLLPKEYEKLNGRNSFWKIVNKHPTFWIDLEPLPGASDLWKYIKNNFTSIPPVILTAGQGNRIEEQKKAWIKRYIDSTVEVILADSGVLKPTYAINKSNSAITHLLLDDMEKNIVAWKNSGENYKAVQHENNEKSKYEIDNIIKNGKN